MTRPPSGRITERALRVLLATTEKTFAECWLTLAAMKEYRRDQFDQHFMDFQPTLAGALFELDRQYHRIAAERRRLIGRKGCLSPSWFRGRLQRLAEYQGAIQEFKGIGWSLGDAFAWFFYQHDRALLEEHRKAPRHRNLPIGIGGVGELEFIKGVRAIEGKFVLYHGITSILRLGDVSLVSLVPPRIVAIAELKTMQAAPGRLTIEANIIGSKGRMRPIRRPARATAAGKSPRPTYPAAMAAQLTRQLGRIVKATEVLHKRVPGVSIETAEPQHTERLAEAIKATRRGGWHLERLDDGLVVLIYRPRTRSFYRLIRAAKHWKPDPPANLAQVVATTVVPDSPYNAVVLGRYHFGEEGEPVLYPGTLPPLWTPMDTETVRQIVFHEVFVRTIYNPAPLITRLEAEGLKLTAYTPPLAVTFERTADRGLRIQLKNFRFYAGLVSQALYREAVVADIIRGSVKAVLDREPPGDLPVRIDMAFSQMLLRRRPR